MTEDVPILSNRAEKQGVKNHGMDRDSITHYLHTIYLNQRFKTEYDVFFTSNYLYILMLIRFHQITKTEKLFKFITVIIIIWQPEIADVTFGLMLIDSKVHGF